MSNPQRLNDDPLPDQCIYCHGQLSKLEKHEKVSDFYAPHQDPLRLVMPAQVSTVSCLECDQSSTTNIQFPLLSIKSSIRPSMGKLEKIPEHPQGGRYTLCLHKTLEQQSQERPMSPTNIGQNQHQTRCPIHEVMIMKSGTGSVSIPEFKDTELEGLLNFGPGMALHETLGAYLTRIITFFKYPLAEVRGPRKLGPVKFLAHARRLERLRDHCSEAITVILTDPMNLSFMTYLGSPSSGSRPDLHYETFDRRGRGSSSSEMIGDRPSDVSTVPTLGRSDSSHQSAMEERQEQKMLTSGKRKSWRQRFAKKFKWPTQRRPRA